jgi:DNA-directed RNA polymerase subunit RPC12/RpoP
MIEFSCIYCGGLIKADAESAGKTVECPACGHSIVVRVREPGEAMKKAAREDTGEQRTTEDWQARSDQEIFDRLLFKTLTTQDRRGLAARRLRWMPIPRCDGLTLLALSLTFSLLWFIDAEPATDLRQALSSLNIGDVRFVPALTVIAAVMSLINLLLDRPKSDRETFMMLLFTMAVATGTGAYAGYIIAQRHLGWLMIFPAWNILSSALLLLLFHLRVADVEHASGTKANLLQVMISAISTTAVLAACHYRFHLHWAVTFSITVGYAMSLHNTICGIFCRRTSRPAVDATGAA